MKGGALPGSAHIVAGRILSPSQHRRKRRPPLIPQDGWLNTLHKFSTDGGEVVRTGEERQQQYASTSGHTELLEIDRERERDVVCETIYLSSYLSNYLYKRVVLNEERRATRVAARAAAIPGAERRARVRAVFTS